MQIAYTVVPTLFVSSGFVALHGNPMKNCASFIAARVIDCRWWKPRKLFISLTLVSQVSFNRGGTSLMLTSCLNICRPSATPVGNVTLFVVLIEVIFVVP